MPELLWKEQLSLIQAAFPVLQTTQGQNVYEEDDGEGSNDDKNDKDFKYDQVECTMDWYDNQQ